MNEIEKCLTYLNRADEIEREAAAETSRVLREAIDELGVLLDRIKAGEFDV